MGGGGMAMLARVVGVVTSAPTYHSHQAPPCISISIITILAKYALHKMLKNWNLPHLVEHQNVLLVRESKTIILTTRQMDSHPLLPVGPRFVRGQNVLYGGLTRGRGVECATFWDPIKAAHLPE